MYSNTAANETSNVLSLLKYTKEYSDIVGKDQFFHVDSTTGTPEPREAEALYNEGFAKRKTFTDSGAVNNVAILLNLYGYLAAFKHNLHPNLNLVIKFILENDNNIVFKNAAAPDSKVIITNLHLCVPKIIFNGVGLKKYLEDYLKPKKWSYLREHHAIKQSGALNDSFRISTGIRRPRHVFVWAVPTLSYGNQGANIFTFGLNKVGGNRSFAKAQLNLNNNTYYPQMERTWTKESSVYCKLMEYAGSYNDFFSGAIIDVSLTFM